MPLKISTNFSEKVGLPGYSSIGASCSIELEADFAVMNNPDEFQKRVAHAYRLCRESVEAELVAHRPGETTVQHDTRPTQDTRPTPPPATEYRNSPPPKTEYRNSPPSSERNDNCFPVSPKQLDFIGKLSKGIRGLTSAKLDEYCEATFGRTSTQLSSQETSRLIDSLKDAKARKEGLA